jgi:hypothetical protein
MQADETGAAAPAELAAQTTDAAVAPRPAKRSRGQDSEVFEQLSAAIKLAQNKGEHVLVLHIKPSMGISSVSAMATRHLQPYLASAPGLPDAVHIAVKASMSESRRLAADPDPAVQHISKRALQAAVLSMLEALGVSKKEFRAERRDTFKAQWPWWPPTVPILWPEDLSVDDLLRIIDAVAG